LPDARDIAGDRSIKLTPRGREVFLRTLAGLTIREIAGQLGMSISGVCRHKENMLIRNDCASMKELIAKYRGKMLKILNADNQSH
jgi:DNA-binding CsgD family transcriptional regulator